MEIKTPTKEQILEAAKSSPEAKKALEKLFPDVFTEGIDLFVSKPVKWMNKWPAIQYDGSAIIRVCSETEFYLLGDYNWIIKNENYLIPTRK